MAITDPRVNDFVDSVLRPLAEYLRNGKMTGDAGIVTWLNEIEVLVANSAIETLTEIRTDGDKVNPVTGADIHSMIDDVLIPIKTALEQAGREALIAKFCVRHPRVG